MCDRALSLTFYYLQSIERLVELYCTAELNEQTRIQTIAEIINDIRNPLEGATQFNLNQMESCEKVQIN